MTRLFNSPDDFDDELVEGFVAANRRWVRPVTGGVVRATRSAQPKVAVVIGGGSGHYPAFGGLVGPGMAAGAAMGNLFASPSAHQVHSVGRAADQGRGVLYSFGNYAGDVLHFGEAAEKLRTEGTDSRIVTVTDDIWSGPADQTEKRRGIAGDLAVFKIAGAAAERGDDLDEVERLARKANDRTRSYGVAFSGCTLPGAEEPLFTVPEGRMAVGLGIHGEPGIDEVDIPTASELATMFIERLLQELPPGIQPSEGRVVPILNGLGSVKYEELFVVYRSVHRLLGEAGVQVVDPEVGEFCTSFDMAGASLTLLWLDDELQELWEAPADSPAFRRGSIAGQIDVSDEDVAEAEEVEVVIEPGSERSQRAAARALTAARAVADALDEAADELGRIDRIAGDGDHGIGMQRGSRAAVEAAKRAYDAGAGIGTLLTHAGEAWSDKGGGTSGAIWGRMLVSVGEVLGDHDEFDSDLAIRAARRAREAVSEFGGAQVGDKTLVDALVPFVEVFSESASTGNLVGAWHAASQAARDAADETADLLPRMGRARSHGDRAIGTPDPGAISLALVAATIQRTLDA